MALTGPQVSAAISGKLVTDEYHWGHRYFADGRVERSENGRQRTARWSVKGNRLCLLQPEVSKDEPICYRVTRDGQELQYKDDAQFVVFRALVLRPMPKCAVNGCGIYRRGWSHHQAAVPTANHINTMSTIPNRLLGLAPLACIHASAWPRHSARTSGGNNLTVSQINAGSSSMSST